MTERIEVLAKTLYFLRTSTPQKPEGSRWERCKDKEKWLRNARQILDTLAGGVLADKELWQVMMEALSKQDPAHRDETKDSQEINRAIAHAQTIRCNAQCQKRIEQVFEEIESKGQEIQVLSKEDYNDITTIYFAIEKADLQALKAKEV